LPKLNSLNPNGI